MCDLLFGLLPSRLGLPYPVQKNEKKKDDGSSELFGLEGYHPSVILVPWELQKGHSKGNPKETKEI